MPSTTTITVDAELKARLGELARQAGQDVDGFVEGLLRRVRLVVPTEADSWTQRHRVRRLVIADPKRALDRGIDRTRDPIHSRGNIRKQTVLIEIKSRNQNYGYSNF